MKFKDNNCWMTENLRLKLSNSITLTSTYSNVYSWKPAHSTIVGASNLNSTTNPKDFSSNFDYKNFPQSFMLSDSADTVYYNWFAATAGTGNANVTTNGTNVSYDICPKGWILPTGGASSNSHFYKLFNSMGLEYGGAGLAVEKSTSWTDADLNIVQSSPYNFAFTGGVESGVLYNTTAVGSWWSRTAGYPSTAYALLIYSNMIMPGTVNTNNARYHGFAIRCITSLSTGGGSAPEV